MDWYISRFRKVVGGLAALVAALMLLVATLSVVVQIVTRYQNNPTLWSLELSQFAVIAMVFIGAATAAREKQHFRIDYISLFLGPRVGNILDTISRIIGLATLAALGFFSIRMLQSVMNTYSTAAQIPVRYVYYLMIYGIASWLLILVFEFFESHPDD